MSLNLNKVILAGRIVAEPELKQTASGISVVSFRIAVNRRSQQQNEADFFNVTAWQNTAEFIAKYFHKGSAICVCGRIQNRTYTDQNGHPDSARTMARHTDTLSFDELARSAARLLAPDGELSVVIPYDRAHDMTVSCACHGLFATRQTIVVPVEGGKPKRILMAFSRSGAAHSVETLCIQDKQRQYTPAYIRLVEDFYLKM